MEHLKSILTAIGYLQTLVSTLAGTIGMITIGKADLSTYGHQTERKTD